MRSASLLLALLVSSALAAPQTYYCPAAGDFVVAYSAAPSNVKLYDGGWAIGAGGAAATAAAFNLLGGFVEYDIDFSSTKTGVNANIYSVSPRIAGSRFAQSDYCDGSRPAGNPDFCTEVDYIETNGNCGGATTLHTVPGPGSGPGCTAWGCSSHYHYDGRTKFHMRIEHAADGSWTTTRDGQVIAPSALNPPPQASDWATVAASLSTRGAVIYSSQWVGWVPVSECGTTGDLATSAFAVSNLRIYGTVVQGPAPRVCTGPQPTLPPTPAPTPAPSPAPSPSSGGFNITVTKDSSWQGGLCRNFIVTNAGATDAGTGWRFVFTLPADAQITSSWNGVAVVSRTSAGNTVSVTPPDWATTLKAGASAHVYGFCATSSGEPADARVVLP